MHTRKLCIVAGYQALGLLSENVHAQDSDAESCLRLEP
jgi:hypothetical protein